MEIINLSIPRLEILNKFPSKLDNPLKLRNCYSFVNREDLPKKAGVYFLLDMDSYVYRVLYIGQTSNIRGRIASHIGVNHIIFNSVSFILEENPILRLAIEQIYTNEYKPIMHPNYPFSNHNGIP